MQTTTVDDDKVTFWISAPPKPMFNRLKPPDISENAMLCGFWWAKKTQNKMEANLVLERKTSKGIEVPILRNSVEIPLLTGLMQYVPASKPKTSTPILDEPGKAAAKAKSASAKPSASKRQRKQ